MSTTFDLYAADTGDVIRPATLDEVLASVDLAERDGGAGIITMITGRRCHVLGDKDVILAAHHLAHTDSGLRAYDANVGHIINLDDCTNDELTQWVESSMAHGDTGVERDARALLTIRGAGS